MKEKTTRLFTGEMRAKRDDERGAYIEGTPILYDSKTDLGEFWEVIDKGALDKTDLKDVRLLVNHNLDMIPLARSRRNNDNSTMKLTPIDIGLDMRANIDIDDNSTAKELYSALNRGDISGMSFMFTIDGESWEDLDSKKPTRHITKIGKVFEVSAVTFPAYEETSISARDKAALESALEALERARAEDSAAELALLKEKNRNI